MEIPNFTKFDRQGVKIAITGSINLKQHFVPDVLSSDPLRYIKRYLTNHDYVFGCLDTIFSGFTSQSKYYNTSGDYFATYLSKYINGVFAASEHSFDCGSDGITETINTLKKCKIDFAGLSEKDNHKKYTDIAVKHYDLSFLSYTDYINGKKETEYFVHKEPINTTPAEGTISIYRRTEARKAIDFAKKRSEIVYAGLYQSNKRSDEAEVGRRGRQLIELISMGADVAINTSSQEFAGAEILPDNKLVIYSLGTFLTWDTTETTSKNVGCILTIEYDSFSNVSYSFLPVATVKSTVDFYHYVIPLAPLELGMYKFIKPSVRQFLLNELQRIREVLSSSGLSEEKLIVHFA